MTREDIIRMAQECWPSDRRMWSVDADLPRLESFAALVAAHEREMCAKICDLTDMRSKEALEYFAAKLAAQAKKEEREECAKACIDTGAQAGVNDSHFEMADLCAEVIKARGKQ